LLSAFGLDIREGSIYTFADAAPSAGPVSLRRPVPRHRPRRNPGLARKKIVDVFQVRPLAGVPFAADQQRLFVHELDGMGRLLDRFDIGGRHGRKIVDPAEQQELRLTAALIKQFTHFLTSAPDPAKAIDYFDRFLDRILEEARDGKALEFLKGKQTLTLLARL